MDYTIIVKKAAESKTILCNNDSTLLAAIQKSGIAIDASCGGNGKCGKCAATITGICRDKSGNIKNYQAEKALTCCLYPEGDITVELKSTDGEKIKMDAPVIAAGGTGLGLAVDIGTTTVAVYLYDLSTGKCIGQRGEMNAQRSFGADVISRITYASERNGLDELRDCIRSQILRLAKDMCSDSGKITYVSIAGNTTMLHLFAGLSPETIGKAPFTPLSLFGEEEDASKYLQGLAENAKIYLCPCVAGYVGGDITAGIMSSGAYKADDSVFFLDIGTNGEMGIGSKDGFITCATAAGPAFEGGNIECGSPARTGAINSVKEDLSYTVLGNTEPESICGSGIIDAIAMLVKNEEIDETGFMEDEQHDFSDKVYICQNDVRSIQLAKAAIRAGLDTLLALTHKTYDDIDEVLIAGGFGAYMNLSSACIMGLLPPAFEKKARHVGNSAGAGAAMALTAEGRSTLAAVTKECTYLELSGCKEFNELYIEAMMFGEDE